MQNLLSRAAARVRAALMPKPFDFTFVSTYRTALVLILAYEAVSFAGYVYAPLNTFAFLCLLATVAVLAVVKPHYAMLLALAELFTGSQGGYLFTIGEKTGLDLSIRHAVFLVVVGVWFAELLASTLAGGERRREAWAWWRALAEYKLLYPYIGVIALICYGVARGVAMGHGFNLVFFDGDRYLYYGIFPAMVAAFLRPGMARRALAVLGAAITSSVLKALTVLFFFSHRVQTVAKTMYVWVRDTRVGEITIQTADFYRIFFQSQIFVLVTLFAAALLFAYARNNSGRTARWSLAFICGAMVAMVLSLSRSFWFGGAVATLAMVAVLLWGRAEPRIWGRLAVLGAGSVYVAVAVIAAVYFFPFPNKSGSLSLASLLGQRALSLDDDAAKSRWALLPKLNEAAMEHPLLGSGFGRTVTYETHDPRLLAANQTSSYTTYAFEWGYHDLWLKLGAFGLALYAWWLVRLFWPLARTVLRSRDAFRHATLAEGTPGNETRTALLAAGTLIGGVALLATNLFSPYLNHPLGIGILLLVGALGASGALTRRPM